MKTLEEFIEKYLISVSTLQGGVKSLGVFEGPIRQAIDTTAAEILRVAEEWCSEYVETGQVATFDTGNEVVSEPVMATVGEFNSANKLYDFLKSYINSTNTEGGE